MDITNTITDLNAGWYNIVTDRMKLDKSTFQLAQGTVGLQSTDSSGLFLMCDAVPPQSAVAYFAAGGLVKRSSVYGGLLNALTDESGRKLRDVLGAKYASWIEFIGKHKGGQEALFKKWGKRHLDPIDYRKGLEIFKQAETLPLYKARDAFNDKNNMEKFVRDDDQVYSLYVYLPNVESAKNALMTSSGSVQIQFDSSSMDTKLDRIWVEGAASGYYNALSGEIGGSFEKLNTEAAKSGLTISARIGKFTTVTVNPGAWFDPYEVKRAHDAKNNQSIWDPLANAGDWESFFSYPNGSLVRYVSQLVLVSDYEITVTSHASYSEEDLRAINADLEFGIWPLFSVSANTSITTHNTRNADGSLSVKYTLPDGAVQVWGATVQQLPE